MVYLMVVRLRWGRRRSLDRNDGGELLEAQLGIWAFSCPSPYAVLGLGAHARRQHPGRSKEPPPRFDGAVCSGLAVEGGAWLRHGYTCSRTHAHADRGAC